MIQHFFSLKDVNEPLMPELRMAAIRALESGWALNGPETKAFETELAAFCGVGHAVGVSNGLDAIRLILRAYIELGRLHAGQEVIYASNTYIASVLPISEFGLTPIAASPDTDTHGIDWHQIMPLITERTGAVIVTHLYGNPSWHSDIAEQLRPRGILIIEDNAQAIGAGVMINDNLRLTGSLGDAAAFSFYPTKNIGAFGDAGAVTTSDPQLAETVRALANYGSDRRYHNIYRGYNCRIDEIQAAMLRVKLAAHDLILRQRQEVAEIYLSEITNPEVVLPARLDGTRQVWHQFVLLAEHRDALQTFLADCGIPTDIHYAVPPHMQPCYAPMQQPSTSAAALHTAEYLGQRLLSLPIAAVTPEQAHMIAAQINRFEHKNSDSTSDYTYCNQ